MCPSRRHTCLGSGYWPPLGFDSYASPVIRDFALYSDISCACTTQGPAWDLCVVLFYPVV